MTPAAPAAGAVAPDWIVLKFGGTSVSRRHRWDTIGELMKRRASEEGAKVLVVVSAVSGVTNELQAICDGHADAAATAARFAALALRHREFCADELGLDPEAVLGERLAALQALADDPRVPAMPTVQAPGDFSQGGRHPVQAPFAPGQGAVVCRMCCSSRLSVEAYLLPLTGLHAGGTAFYTDAVLGDRDHAVVALHGQIKCGSQCGDGALWGVYLEWPVGIGGDLEPGLPLLQLQLAALCIDAHMHFAAR